MMITAHWSANPPVLAACAVVAVVHLAGLVRGRATGAGASPEPEAQGTGARQPGARPGRRAGQARAAVAFYFGLLVVLIALVSPVGYWSLRYIWVRAIQDLLLATVAPPLIVLGAPWLPLRLGLDVVVPPGGALRRGLDAIAPPGGALRRRLRAAVTPDRARADRAPARPWWLTLPALVAIAFNVAWWAWHLPALFDLALTSRIAYAAEVVTYLGLGIAFWLALIGSAPFSPRLTPLQRVTIVFATVVSDTVLGMMLVFGSSLLYTSYPDSTHHVLSVVADQQVAGAVLWMGLLPTFVILAVALFLRWLNDEETEDLTAGLERMLGPRRYTWPSGRGLK
jgi:putative membrane protein